MTENPKDSNMPQSTEQQSVDQPIVNKPLDDAPMADNPVDEEATEDITAEQEVISEEQPGEAGEALEDSVEPELDTEEQPDEPEASAVEIVDEPELEPVPEEDVEDDVTEYEPYDDETDNIGKPIYVAIVAVVTLVILSLLPWSKLTDNQLKDFSLISDIKPTTIDSIVGGEEFIDPELLALMGNDSVNNSSLNPGFPATPIANTDNNGWISDATQVNDSSMLGNDQKAPDNYVPEAMTARVDGKMVIEDYTPGSSGLRHLKTALANSGCRPVRIGVIGDSYIEGDIFTSDIRRQLQERYGGRGVGYLPAHSQVAGFRPTVKHTSSGWTQHDVKEASKSRYFTLAGEYFTGNNGATIKFNGVDNMGNAVKAWNTSMLMFIAPKSGKITLEGDGISQTYDIEASDAVQTIVLNGETSSLKVTNNVSGLILLGAWLQDANGVTVDCMSVRGDSGVNRRGINTSLASEMRQAVNYDLIVVEYGINALTSKQKDYTTYSNTMVEVIKRIKQCYPNADIILMGIGDRGQKINGEARSFTTAANMVEAQREAARKAGVLFYDTRESMGGDGAIVKWRNDKLANGDYIHLNFKGGKVLADTFVDALIRKVSE